MKFNSKKIDISKYIVYIIFDLMFNNIWYLAEGLIFLV